MIYQIRNKKRGEKMKNKLANEVITEEVQEAKNRLAWKEQARLEVY